MAMADPANIFAIDDVRIVTGREIRPVVAAESDLVAAIDKFSASQTNVNDMVGDLEQAVGHGAAEEDGDEVGEDSVVARMMNQVVTEAIRQGAGDIYIEPVEYGTANPVPNRRRVPGGQHVSQEASSPGDQPPQDQLGHGHRRAPHSARRAFRRRSRRQGGGLPRRGPARSFTASLPFCDCCRRDSIMMSLKDLGFLEQNLNRLLDALALPYGDFHGYGVQQAHCFGVVWPGGQAGLQVRLAQV